MKIKLDKMWQLLILLVFIIGTFTYSAWAISESIQYTINGIVQTRAATAIAICAPWMIGVMYLCKQIVRLFEFVKEVRQSA